MSFWKNFSGKNNQSLDNYTVSKGVSSNVEFYEFEPAVVLDVILDETHDVFTSYTELTKIDYSNFPSDVSKEQPIETDVDFSWIGRCLVRMVNSQKKMDKDSLVWALPLETNISEYPLINEVVSTVVYMGKLYYTRKINLKNFVNSNVDFGIEPSIGGFFQKGKRGNCELLDNKTEFVGPKSITRHGGGFGFEGVAGRYFTINDRIRAVKRYEGDLVVESRFGQSIRFSAYDENRNNDVGVKNTDYDNGGGNPMIVIRNRQRPIKPNQEEYAANDKVTPCVGTITEKNAGGTIREDINNDGSTIAITSGMTITKWVSSCYKNMWGEKTEEQTAFSPSGCSKFKYPILNGDQIVINSDRLILSSRNGETFHYSKKRYSVVTDSECSLDSHDQLILTSNQKTVINSPAIFLGEYDASGEPALLGQTTINWLYELVNILIEHTHWYKHTHSSPDAGKENPSQTQVPVQIQKLIDLRDKLHTLLSRRVFLTGGGFESGKDGGTIKNGTEPLKIDVKTGNGVPGGWTGTNFR